MRRSLFRTTEEPAAAVSAGRASKLFRGLNEDRDRIGAEDLIAEHAWRGEGALIDAAEDGTDPASNAGIYSGNKLIF